MNVQLQIVVAIGFLAAGPAQGACGVGGNTTNKVIVGTVRTCESARFYFEAFTTAKEWNLEEQLKDPNLRISPTQIQGFEWTKNGIVVVVSVEAQFPIPLGWQAEGVPGRRPEANWIALADNLRYWWRGDAEDCEALVGQRHVKLRVKSPCCDTLPFFGSCLLGMNHAEPLTPEMLATMDEELRGALLAPFAGRPRSDAE